MVIHQLTSLPKAIDPRQIETQLADNDRIRTEGTANLIGAAGATVRSVGSSQTGTSNIVDHDPATVSQWLPVYASALDARAPARVPAVVARILAGRYGAYTMTEQRGTSNVKAKRELGWTPVHGSWRTGFRETLDLVAGPEERTEKETTLAV